MACNQFADSVKDLYTKSHDHSHMWLTHIVPYPLSEIVFNKLNSGADNAIWTCGIKECATERFVKSYNNTRRVDSILDVGSYHGNSLARYSAYFSDISQNISLYGIDISPDLINISLTNTTKHSIQYEVFNASLFMDNITPKSIPTPDVIVMSDILYCFNSNIIPSLGGAFFMTRTDKQLDAFVKCLTTYANKLIVFSNHQNNQFIIKFLNKYCVHDKQYDVYYIDIPDK